VNPKLKNKTRNTQYKVTTKYQVGTNDYEPVRSFELQFTNTSTEAEGICQKTDKDSDTIMYTTHRPIN